MMKRATVKCSVPEDAEAGSVEDRAEEEEAGEGRGGGEAFAVQGEAEGEEDEAGQAGEED